ncbi:hypothetical protein FRC08_009938, partial [Ceratobasidium sp. 394]
QRPPAAEQSRLQDVSAWIGSPGKPLFHYIVNVLRIPALVESGRPRAGILERIKAPVDPGSGPGGFQASSRPPFSPMEEVLDDCIIDIFFDGKKDSIGMQMTCQGRAVTESEARELAEAWAQEVRDAFSS